MRKKHVVIIGGGFGGLSASALLAKQGFKVTLLEKNKDLGGRARVWKQDGFSFDMGPSWYLMPEVYEKFFAIFGKKSSDYYELKRLDPSYRIFFGKDEKIDISTDPKQNEILFDSFEEKGGEKFRKYLDFSKYQYDISMKSFIYKDYPNLLSFFDKELLKVGPKLKVFESMERYVHRFFNSDKARKVLLYNIVFLGGSPKITPAIYSVMAHADFNLGVWYPLKGFGAIVNAMTQIAKEQGVQFKTNCIVKKIVVNKSGIAEKVLTNRGEIKADVVLANADYSFVETSLLDNKFQSYPLSYWKKKTIAPSGFILYLGLNKKIKNLAHHNLFLANDWVNHFDEIFKNPSWPENPSYYVCAPSKTDPSVAPKNYENIFILVPIASGIKDTKKMREQFSKKIVNHLEELIEENIEESIILKRTFSLNDFKDDYNAFQGTALGLTHTLLQTAVFRPKNKSQKVKNLYYTGQYTLPGTGVPMVIISSEIVTKKIVDEQL